MVTEIWAVVIVLLSTVIGSGGALFFKLSSEKLKLSIKGILKNHKMIFGIGLYFISALIFITALRGGEVNVLYPITSAGYIWVTLLSKRYLKEKVNPYKIIGISFILFGIIFITS